MTEYDRLDAQLANDPLVREWRALADAFLHGSITAEEYQAAFQRLNQRLPETPCERCAALRRHTRAIVFVAALALCGECAAGRVH